MYPIGQTPGGPGPVGPPPNHNQQSSLGSSTSLGLGGLGPMMPSSHTTSGSLSGPPGGGHLTGVDTPPLGPPGMPPVGATTLIGSGNNGGTPTTVLPPGGLGLGFGGGLSTGSPPLPDNPTFFCPRRPNIGRDGRPILLRANHFQISMPRGYINHYQIRY